MAGMVCGRRGRTVEPGSEQLVKAGGDDDCANVTVLPKAVDRGPILKPEAIPTFSLLVANEGAEERQHVRFVERIHWLSS